MNSIQFCITIMILTCSKCTTQKNQTGAIREHSVSYSGLSTRAVLTHTVPEEKPVKPFSAIDDAKYIFFSQTLRLLQNN